MWILSELSQMIKMLNISEPETDISGEYWDIFDQDLPGNTSLITGPIVSASFMSLQSND